MRVVNVRGRYMQEAVAEGRGAMAAILGLEPEGVVAACAAAAAASGSVVSPANYNSPQQTVIAGERAAVLDAGERAMAAGAKRVIELPVSAPFHCELMRPAAERLRPELDAITWSAPKPPVVTNVDAEPNSDASRIPALLEQQVTAPVRFTEMIERLTALGVTGTLEIGAGRVLSGLLARIDRRSKRSNLGGFSELEEARAFCTEIASG